MTAQLRRLDNGIPLPTVAASRKNFRRVVEIDEGPELSWRNAADRDRLAAFQEGAWHLIGIQAKADIIVRRDGRPVAKSVTSPGMWGIDSDSDESYLDDVFAAECDRLADMIEALGVTVTA